MPPAAGVGRPFHLPFLIFHVWNVPQVFPCLPLQGRQTDASETGGAAIERLGPSPWRCSCQSRNSRQRSKLLHGESRSAAHTLLSGFVRHPPLFPLSEWTHVLHWGRRPFYSSRPRWDTNGEKRERETWPSWLLMDPSAADMRAWITPAPELFLWLFVWNKYFMTFLRTCTHF